MRWARTTKFDPVCCSLADRHYPALIGRRKKRSPQWLPPGATVALRTPDGDAAWGTSLQLYRADGFASAWICSFFRNENRANLSSELIVEALAATHAEWPVVPEKGVITFVDVDQVRAKRDPGRCFRKAGFVPAGFSKSGRLILWLAPALIPEPVPALRLALPLFDDFGPGVSESVWDAGLLNTRERVGADVLRQIPAAVRFISAEPLLGSLYDGRTHGVDVDVVDTGADRASSALAEVPGVRHVDRGSQKGGVVRGGECDRSSTEHRVALDHVDLSEGPLPEHRIGRAPLDLAGIDWVIVGGESGHGARPFHLEHAREIVSAVRFARNEARVAGELLYRSNPSMFVKQLGGRPVFGASDLGNGFSSACELRLRDSKGGNISEWPTDLRIREFPRVVAA